MDRSRYIVIHFEYDGHYEKDGDSESFKWVGRENQIHTVVMNFSLEEVSYAMLVDKISIKIMVNQAINKLKLSYIPLGLEHKKPSYILDDESVLGYLMDVNKEQRRSVLNVERIEEEQSIQNYEVDNEEVGIFDTNYDIPDDVEHTFAEETTVFPNHEWEDGLSLSIGDEFKNKKEVQTLVEKASNLQCFAFYVDKSTSVLYVVKCQQVKEGCKWFLRAAKLKDSEIFTIRTYNKIHTCSRAAASTRKKRRNGTPQMVASLLHEEYQGQCNTTSPKNLMSMVQGKLGVKVSYSTALRGKKHAINEGRGNPEESYQLLFSYLFMLEQKNPDTITCVELDDNQRFKYLFIALRASIEGFALMRKVIIVDATFLKNKYGGVLIVATAQDANCHHYPIAFGVVDGEKDASWLWFMETLKTVVRDDPELVFVSDRNSSIIKAISEVFEKAQHRYCIFHLSQNVKTQVHYTKRVNRESVAVRFRNCAQAYTEFEFNKLYGEFRKRYPSAGEYLDKSVDVRKWAKCYFPGQRYDIYTTNSAESLNSVFKEVRKYSLLPMLDGIIGKMSEWFARHRKSAIELPSSQMLVPYVENEMHKRCREASFLEVQEINGYMQEYNVLESDNRSYLVDLKRKTCSCKRFDIDEYPCVHALAAIRSDANNQISVYEFCSKYYLVEHWISGYRRSIYPVPHKSEWMVPEDIQQLRVMPPKVPTKRGKVQQKRHPSVGEFRKRKKPKKI